MKKLIIIPICLLFVIPFIMADQTVKTVEIPLGYEAMAGANTIYYYNLSVDYPDGIDRVLAMEILVKGDYAANTISYAGFLVDDTVVYCTPSQWTIYLTSNNYEMSFDCTPLLQSANWQGGNITFVMMSDTLSANVKTRVKLTYYNNPLASMIVTGTYYESGDIGRVYVQVADDGVPVTNASCYATIYAPDYTIWADSQLLVELPGESGMYVYPFVAPNETGVYGIAVSCQYDYSTFWVYQADDIDYVDYTVTLGTWDGGAAINLNDYADGLYMAFTSGGGATKSVDVYYDFDITGKVTIDNTTDIYLHWLGEATGTPTLTMYWWNWTSGVWVTFPDTLTLSGKGGTAAPTGADDYLSSKFLFDNYNDVINSSNIIRVRTLLGGPAIFNYWHNWLALRFNSPSSSTLSQIRGGGEINVKNRLEDIPFNVWNYTNRTLTATGQHWVGKTEYVPNEIGKVVIRAIDSNGEPLEGADCEVGVVYPNNTFYINRSNMTEWAGNITGIYYFDFLVPDVSGIYTYGVDCFKGGKDYYMLNTFHVVVPEVYAVNNITSEEIWNYTNRNLTYYPPTTTAEGVWNYTNRTLTYYEDVTNYTLIPIDVWNYANRTLTYYDVNNITPNDIWAFINRNLTYYPPTTTAEQIWNYTNRNLTYYEDTTNYTRIPDDVWGYSGNVTSNLLAQFATDIWGYVARYTHGVVI